MKDKEKVRIALGLFEQNSREKWKRLYKELFEQRVWHIGPEDEPMTSALYRKIKFKLLVKYGKFW